MDLDWSLDPDDLGETGKLSPPRRGYPVSPAVPTAAEALRERKKLEMERKRQVLKDLRSRGPSPGALPRPEIRETGGGSERTVDIQEPRPKTQPVAHSPAVGVGSAGKTAKAPEEKAGLNSQDRMAVLPRKSVPSHSAASPKSSLPQKSPLHSRSLANSTSLTSKKPAATPTAKSSAAPSGPPPRTDGMVAAVGSHVVVHGGLGALSGAVLDDTWVIDMAESQPSEFRWRLAAPMHGPGSVYGASWAVDQSSACIYLHGGKNAEGSGVQGLWRFDVSRRQWDRVQEKAGAELPALQGQTVTFQRPSTLWIFGGSRSGRPADAGSELWRVDLGSNGHTAVASLLRFPRDGPIPDARSHAVCFWSESSHSLYVTGGLGAEGPIAAQEWWQYSLDYGQWHRFSSDPAVVGPGRHWSIPLSANAHIVYADSGPRNYGLVRFQNGVIKVEEGSGPMDRQTKPGSIRAVLVRDRLLVLREGGSLAVHTLRACELNIPDGWNVSEYESEHLLNEIAHLRSALEARDAKIRELTRLVELAKIKPETEISAWEDLLDAAAQLRTRLANAQKDIYPF